MKSYATVYSGTGYGVSWSYDDSTKVLTITGGSMTNGTSYSSYPWYSYVSKATKIVCNNSGAIGDYAFESCYYASTIDIGANVTSIGASAFYYSGRYQATDIYVRRNGNVT
ncbi:MAG: leucine-rich repeat protein, partial [Lachnospiraceae bacterium]|nr:leucine-rich repeat protein [Lachnospiraceae bacterium]